MPTLVAPSVTHHRRRRQVRAPRILVVDDDPLVRRALETLLLRAAYNVSTAASVSEALPTASAEGLDAAIIDLVLDDGSGVDLAHKLRMMPLPTAALLITGSGSIAVARHAIAQGVADYLPKPVRSVDLLAALGRVVETTRLWRNRIDASGQGQGKKPDDAGVGRDIAAAAREARLSPRERAVLYQMMQGRRYRHIAEVLDISERTVKFHAGNILRKFGAKTRSELPRLLGDITGSDG